MRQSLFILLLGFGSLLASCDGAPPQPGGQAEQPSQSKPDALGGAEQEPLPATQPDLEKSDNAITPQSAPADPKDPFSQGGSSDAPAQPEKSIPYENEGAADPQTTGELPLITEPAPSSETPSQ
ncbi:MAG: hypothetical protein WA902_12825 [Thermosynechococcaceae cyanobacterium]